jgi:hypothetical protein
MEWERRENEWLGEMGRDGKGCIMNKSVWKKYN